MSCDNIWLHRTREVNGIYHQYITEVISLMESNEKIGHIKFTVLHDRNEIWISEIIVKRRYRGKGYGKRLLEIPKVTGALLKLPVRLAAHPDVVYFYNLHGFRITQKGDKDSPIDIMEWNPC